MRYLEMSSRQYLPCGVFHHEKKRSKNVIFTSENKNPITPTQKKEINSTEEKTNLSKKLKSRRMVDVFTVSAYTLIVSAAIAANKCRPKSLKMAAKLAKNEEAVNVAKNGLIQHGKVLQGKASKGGLLYRFSDACGRAKEDSAELTNNLVYGFGTLVIMPLVILFSPIGKKDATKEDRTFTVLRQPVSFATVFALQLTFEKLFKSLNKDVNKYGLLDGAKGKDGKELFFSEGRIKEVFKESFGKDKNGKLREEFKFNLNGLSDKTFMANREKHSSVLEVFGLKDKYDEAIAKEGKFDIPTEVHNKKYTLDEFTDTTMKVIKKIGDEKPKEKVLMDFKNLFSSYTKEMPQLSGQLENMAKAAARGRSLKEILAIIANSIISQALGIMMLNFLYGKMMKKYGEIKHKIQEGHKTAEGGLK